jgi:hypothetical protein
MGTAPSVLQQGIKKMKPNTILYQIRPKILSALTFSKQLETGERNVAFVLLLDLAGLWDPSDENEPL